MQTFFILGSHPDLAKAEILSVVGSGSKILMESSTVLVLDHVDPMGTHEGHPYEYLQNRLGGTIKIGIILDEYLGSDARACANAIVGKASEATGKNKITFGFSAYDLGNPKAVQRIARSFKTLGGEIKNALRDTDRPVRFVMAKDEALTSVVVETNGLNESGGEFCMFATSTSIILGRTSTVQDFKAWSDRDFGRPARDSRSGMLPPKLARMMINLSGVNPSSSIILDPFCGSGTIPMEAALMGFKHIIGSDISEKAVKDSVTNNEWLYAQKFLHPITDKNEIEFHVSKAEAIDRVVHDPVDAIVAETFLGPPKHGWDRPALEALKAELMKMYRDSLVTLAKKLKPNGTIVIAFPAFVVRNEIIKLPLKKAIEDAGLTIDGTWIYKRPDQMTAREIVRMKKRT